MVAGGGCWKISMMIPDMQSLNAGNLAAGGIGMSIEVTQKVVGSLLAAKKQSLRQQAHWLTDLRYDN